MKTKIGLIGPEDSISRFLDVAREYEDEIEILPGTYKLKEESKALVKMLEKEVDVFLFTGIIPYKIVAYAHVTEKPCLYLPRLGTSVIKVLWEMRNNGEDYTRISVDSIDRRDVEEAAQELGFQYSHLEIIENEEGVSYEALAELHRACYAAGKTSAALSGLSRTCSILRALGVPTYRTYPTKYLIRECIQNAIHIAVANKMMAYQISVIILKIMGGDDASTLWYDHLRVKNAFERILIDYTKKIFGSFFPFGRDEYIVFATRGSMEDLRTVQELLDAASSLGIRFAAGLGYGTTAFNAEYNARIALARARAVPESCMFTVDVGGDILGPVSSGRSPLRYNIAETDEDVRKVASDTGLSAAHVSKIKSMLSATHKSVFDAEEMSAYLDISPRSARRILQSLENSGHAQVAALKSKSTTGRPRRVYELKL